MNARFNMNTPEEAAKSIGVSTPVVVGWCRTGVINCNKVGGGTQKDRYEISDDEVSYIRKLIHKFGAKQGILRYRKDWAKGAMPAQTKPEKEEPHIIGSPSPSQEYLWRVAANYIGIDEAALRRYCVEGRINCRVEKNEGGKGNRYFIPGWELLYIKGLYDRYGKVGRFSAMHYYVKDRNDATCNPDEVVNGVLEWKRPENSEPIGKVDKLEYSDSGVGFYSTLYSPNHPDVLLGYVDEHGNTPKKNDLVTTFNYILEVKERIQDCKEELASLEKEYADLRKEIDDALSL